MRIFKASTVARGSLVVFMVAFALAATIAPVSATGFQLRQQAANELDMAGAIQIKDPFAACHADNYDVMEELGVKMNRKDITWSQIENPADTWNWDQWDTRVNALQAKNMTVLPILDYENPAVQQDLPEGGREVHGEHDIARWLEYVNMCVERYYVNHSMGVSDWEIWNEPNLEKFWTGTDEQFFELQKRTAANLSAQYPDLNIVSTGISGHNPDYLDAMFEYGAMDNVTTLAFHPYSGANYDDLDAKIGEVKAVGEKHGFQGEYWITEVGMSTQFDPDVPGFEVAYQDLLELQASLVPKVYAKALAGGIELVVWYCLQDEFNFTWGEHNFGLVYYDGNTHKPAVYADDTLKPSGYAYKALAHRLNWSTYVPNGVVAPLPLPSALKLEAYYFLTAGGDVVLIAWNANADDITLRFSMPATTVDVFSPPAYKPGEARNYAATPDGAGAMDVEVTVGFYPTIVVLGLAPGADPVPILIQPTFTGLDLVLVVIVPLLLAACVAVVVVKSLKKPRGE